MKEIRALIFFGMHAAVMLAVVLLAKWHADDRITIAVVAGWFGFLSADRMRGQSPIENGTSVQNALVATPVPKTKALP